MFFGDMDIPCVGKLQQAALHQKLGRLGEGFENRGVDIIGEQGQRLGDQVIPDQYAGIITPFGIDG